MVVLTCYQIYFPMKNWVVFYALPSYDQNPDVQEPADKNNYGKYLTIQCFTN